MTLSKTSTGASSVEQRVLRQTVIGSRRFSNLFWATIVQVGGAGFLLAGLSSYLRVNLLPFSDPTQLIFVPQGLAMSFYGVSATLLGLYLWLTMGWDVGGGYNEFDKDKGQVTIFRWGFPGKNRQIELTCKTEEVAAVKVDLRDGLSPKRSLYLRVKNRRDIPLTRVGQPISLAELENQGAALARFLEVPLEGL
jgi:hypothetical protein